MYNKDCKGCQLALGKRNIAGGTVDLGEYWMVNHYAGEEGFLGWLVMQPKEHFMELSEFAKKELEEFGIQLKRLEKAIQQVWKELKQDDSVERIYVILFFESGLEKDELWHIHFHVIPRTKSIGEEEPSSEEKKLKNPRITNHKAWYIVRSKPAKDPKPKPAKVEEFMNLLRKHLE
jgi:diadenosine tetraphosphate (Ap4A) HIT family hydrolase